MYAAEHKCRLPASLADVTEVPLPEDPISGKPFEHKVTGDRAHVAAPLPAGPLLAPHLQLVY